MRAKSRKKAKRINITLRLEESPLDFIRKAAEHSEMSLNKYFKRAALERAAKDLAPETLPGVNGK